MPLFTDFPPDDLLNTLVDLYFRQVNDSAPLLHEPLFKDGLKSGLHLRHGPFGAIVLLVCAHGSRFTQDPRVLLEGTEEMTSSGWKWYQMVERAMRLPMAPAQLYDLQIYAVRALVGSQSLTAYLTQPSSIADDRISTRHICPSVHLEPHRYGHTRGRRCGCA